MSHYICTGGCGGVAEATGNCQEEVCDNWGEPLEQCECTDNTHPKPSEAPAVEEKEE